MEEDPMTDDGRANAGVIAPPPLIYAIPLLLGLLLKRRFPVPFLPRGAARVLGLPLLGGGVLLIGWFSGPCAAPRRPLIPASRCRG